jgi:mannuronan 5-epimerase
VTRSRQGRKGSIGVYVLVIVVAFSCGLIATFGFGRVFRTAQDAASGSAVRPAYVPAPDPIARAEGGLLPDTTIADPGQPSPTVRTIQVFPTMIYLTAGGRIARQIDLATPARSLIDIVNLVGDRRWIKRDDNVVTLSAGLILEPNAEVEIAAPISNVVMEVKAGVYLGATGAHLTINGVTIQASDDKIPHDGEVGDGARPFVMASDESRMDIVNSRFLYLGRDWNASYGVSWVRKATGSALGSTFEKNFIGAFADHAHDIVLRNNMFRDNVLYGFDPHSMTTGLLVENNVAEGNGRHGIIFSDHVTASIVRNNLVRNNKINGIMMDFSSDQNVIEGNRVLGNRGDGLVMSASAQNRVISNVIENNRVGIHVYGRVLVANDFQRNTVRNNVIANQGAALNNSNLLQGNGNRWKSLTIPIVWVVTVAVGLLLCLMTWSSRRQRVTRVARYNERVRRARAGVA